MGISIWVFSESVALGFGSYSYRLICVVGESRFFEYLIRFSFWYLVFFNSEGVSVFFLLGVDK